ncbi:MAG: signal peptidase I [Planctomycetota bacterium]|nr:signal peptidase I [Planctomycetota bacterium]
MSEAEPKEDKKKSFWDSWTFFAIFLGLLLILRFVIFEPFKIPSGSMEPTLIGHEDYGDRIVTNKIAYVGLTHALAPLALVIALLLAAFVLGKAWKRLWTSFVLVALMAVVAVGGFLAWQRQAIAGEPERFDVVVFEYDPAWAGSPEKPKNYIKRLVGLPGDTLVISGGDLFLRDKATREDRIVRKFEHDPDLQRNLWQPVVRTAFREKPVPDVAADADAMAKIARDAVITENAAAFPWKVNGGTAKRVYREAEKRWLLDVEGPCELAYAYPVTNAYCKLGRWPFVHVHCPRSQLEKSSGGITFRDSRATSPYIRPYIANSWSGVRCPKCGEVAFPLTRTLEQIADGEPQIVPDFNWHPVTDQEDEADPTGAKSEDEPGARARPDYGDTAAGRGTPFFYGGHPKESACGDVKIELAIAPKTSGGALVLEAGSDRHRAVWSLSLGGEAPKLAADAATHPCPESATLSAGQTHVVSLAFVDGTVVAELDGRELPPLKVEVAPLGSGKRVASVAKVRLTEGAKAEIARLDLFHDLYYTTSMDSSFGENPIRMDGGEPLRDKKRVWQDGMYVAEIPKFNPNAPDSEMNKDMYMVLGDNSPSSQDSRVWGFVPRQNFVGRGSLIWWPPSRWRILH